METYIKITIGIGQEPLRELLIAQLSACGFEGFEERPLFLDAFIQEQLFSPIDLAGILEPHGLSHDQALVLPENWNKEWEAHFEPVLVEGFCAIRAAFHLPISGQAHEVIITPKMSFGTGHHATTWLMTKGMSQLEIGQKQVLDFGTGTGILAILAEKCGAKHALAIDLDPWSIENAAENILQNQCGRVALEKGSHFRHRGQFDLILANISKAVIIQSFPDFQQHIAEGGVLLASGFLASDLPEVLQEAKNCHFQAISTMEKDSWSCIAFKQA